MSSGAGAQRGAFTLLELLVVVTMIGILAAIAVVKAGRVISQTKVQRAAQKVQTDIQQAYAIAGRNRQPVILRWSSSALQFQVTDRTQATVYRQTGVGAEAGLGLASSEVTVYPTTVTVFPNGIASDTMNIKFLKDGFQRVLSMSKAGIVRLQ